ncbi:uncharacterized protein LOC114316778 [Camellia sinensis]|uniref:uncharacterized protein LOC114316778 n=1 Tax=Camellia sinensis TaxID=4442 RepID=UPI001036DA0F|nr:uncharacterized protein LOC114316778 [Camellia sinensis]
MLYGLIIPQKYAAHSGNFEMNSQFLETVSEGRTIGDLDLNFMNPNANNLEKHNKNFDSESFRRASVELSLARKHRDFDLNVKLSTSVDFHSSDTIPTMELLNLMDARMQPSSTISLDGKPLLPNFFTKHFSLYDHHPKIGLDETSKILEKPLLSYVHHSKEFSNRGSGVFGDSSSFGFYEEALQSLKREGKHSWKAQVVFHA